MIEIGEDGSAVTYSRPTQFLAEGARDISPVSLPSAAPRTHADVGRLIAEAAQRQSLSVDLVTEVAWRESRLRQTARSPKDAVGVMQLTAGTARDLGVDRYDTAQNIHGGAAYLRQMLNRYGGDVSLALAAYNAGPGAVDRHRGVPPYRETTAYVASILTNLSQRAAIASGVPAIGR